MESSVYQIQSPALRPFVQYVLFNFAGKNSPKQRVVSLPNSNFCLGITNGQALCELENGMVFRSKPGMSTYLSGLYTAPHVFCSTGELDEICIDFTLAGYHRFFTTPPATYLLDEDLLSPNFGPGAKDFFEQLFTIKDRYVRGQGIEQFLLFQMRVKNRQVPSYLNVFNHCSPFTSVQSIAKSLQYSERKLQRVLADGLAVSPKQLLRIFRFRNLLAAINHPQIDQMNWEYIAYQNGYFDYSHLHRDFCQLTGRSPLTFLQDRKKIDELVTVCLA